MGIFTLVQKYLEIQFQNFMLLELDLVSKSKGFDTDFCWNLMSPQKNV